MDTMLTGILSETESEYDRYWYNIEFCSKLMEQQQEMERFVNESLIIASGNKQAIQEMVIINEGAFTDKIKGFFEKIKNFFKKIFSKFGASMTALLSEQKKYIDKYVNIILNCKYVASDIEDVKDHFKGIERITDVIKNVEQAVLGNNNKYLENNSVGANLEMTASNEFPYNNVNEMLKKKDNLPKKINLDDGSVKNTAYEEFTKEGYWNNKEGFVKISDDNNNTDIENTFRYYFDGSEKTVKWTIGQIESNFQTIINTTYSGDNYVKKLESIVTTVTKKMDEISNKMESYYKEQSNKIKQAINNMKVSSTVNNPQSSQTNTGQSQEKNKSSNSSINNPQSSQTNTGQSQEKNESFNYKNFFNEIKETENSQVKVPSETGKKDIQDADNAINTITSKKVSNITANDIDNIDGITDENKKEVLDIANKLLDIDIYNRQAAINSSVQISSAITRCMFKAFQLANKDFFWLIQHHVQWYLSNPGAEKQPANRATTTRSKSTDIFANSN